VVESFSVSTLPHSVVVVMETETGHSTRDSEKKEEDEVMMMVMKMKMFVGWKTRAYNTHSLTHALSLSLSSPSRSFSLYWLYVVATTDWGEGSIEMTDAVRRCI